MLTTQGSVIAGLLLSFCALPPTSPNRSRPCSPCTAVTLSGFVRHYAGTSQSLLHAGAVLPSHWHTLTGPGRSMPGQGHAPRHAGSGFVRHYAGTSLFSLTRCTSRQCDTHHAREDHGHTLTMPGQRETIPGTLAAARHGCNPAWHVILSMLSLSGQGETLCRDKVGCLPFEGLPCRGKDRTVLRWGGGLLPLPAISCPPSTLHGLTPCIPCPGWAGGRILSGFGVGSPKPGGGWWPG
jgi:hypothetical protein